ncbi:hypothetical protein BH09ACT13_BH09ACT13_16490 [soil metagenome]
MTLDAAGPERWKFTEFVRLIARATGGRARIAHCPQRLALGVARAAGLLLRDVVVTRDELDALAAGLLVSHEPPLGVDRFGEWLAESAEALGRGYSSELARNFRG